MNPAGAPSKSPKTRIASPLEWAVAAVGVALVAALIGYLGYVAWRGDEQPPRIALRVVDIERAGEHWLLRFRAENEGGQTAADLRIVAELFRGREVIETGEVTLQYLPAGGRGEGGFFFRENPRQHRVRLSPVSYRTP